MSRHALASGYQEKTGNSELALSGKLRVRLQANNYGFKSASLTAVLCHETLASLAATLFPSGVIKRA